MVKKERENLINFRKEFLMCQWWGYTIVGVFLVIVESVLINCG